MFGRNKQDRMQTGFYEPQGGRSPIVILSGKEVIEIYDLPATVGRNGEEVDVYLFDDSISRIHCRIDIYQDQITLTDLHSTFGTKIEKQQLVPGQPYLLEPGQKVRIGKKKYKVDIDYQALYMYRQQASSQVRVQQEQTPRFSFDDEPQIGFGGAASAGAQGSFVEPEPQPEIDHRADTQTLIFEQPPGYDYDAEVTEPLIKKNAVYDDADDGEKTEVIFFDEEMLKPRFTNMQLVEDGSAEPVCVIDKSPFVIGRKADGTDAAIDAYGISRQHLRIDKVENDFFVTDLASTNGVLVNGEKIEPNVEVKIVEGDMIRFGEKEYRFEKQ